MKVDEKKRFAFSLSLSLSAVRGWPHQYDFSALDRVGRWARPSLISFHQRVRGAYASATDKLTLRAGLCTVESRLGPRTHVHPTPSLWRRM